MGRLRLAHSFALSSSNERRGKLKLIKKKRRVIFKVKSKKKVVKKIMKQRDKLEPTYNKSEYFWCSDYGCWLSPAVCIHREMNWQKYDGWKRCSGCVYAEKFRSLKDQGMRSEREMIDIVLERRSKRKIIKRRR